VRCPACKNTLHGDVGSFALYGLRMGMAVAVEDDKPHVLGLLLVLLVSNVTAFCFTSAQKCLFHSSALLLYFAFPSVVIFLIPIF